MLNSLSKRGCRKIYTCCKKIPAAFPRSARHPPYTLYCQIFLHETLNRHPHPGSCRLLTATYPKTVPKEIGPNSFSDAGVAQTLSNQYAPTRTTAKKNTHPNTALTYRQKNKPRPQIQPEPTDTPGRLDLRRRQPHGEAEAMGNRRDQLREALRLGGIDNNGAIRDLLTRALGVLVVLGRAKRPDFGTTRKSSHPRRGSSHPRR